MNLSDLVLTKAPLTWLDVHKQLLNAIQARSGVQSMSASQLNVVVSGQLSAAATTATGSSGSATSAVASAIQTASSGLTSVASGSAIAAIISSSNSSIVVNKPLVKQCTDLLIKHLKSMI